MLACIPCGNKKFVTQAAYRNHAQSKKHKIAEAKYDEKADREGNAARAAEAAAAVDGGDGGSGAADTGSAPPAASTTRGGPLDPVRCGGPEIFDDGASVMSGMTSMTSSTYPEPVAVELELEDCIFCRHKSDSLEDSLKHMVHAHGFFIPDLKYVCDLVGLVMYLQTKVSVYHMCLLCNGRGRAFRSMEAARGHMVDKGHCFVEYEEEGQLELEEFYDFSSSYPDYDPEMVSTNARRVGSIIVVRQHQSTAQVCVSIGMLGRVGGFLLERILLHCVTSTKCPRNIADTVRPTGCRGCGG